MDNILTKIKLNLNPRMKALYYQTYLEENINFDFDEHDDSKKDIILLYPRSYINNINKLENDKTIDYNFIGTLFFTQTFKNRRWILDFCKKHFTNKSYLVITDVVQNINPKRWKQHLDCKSLGIYDKTLEMNANDVYIPLPRNCNTFESHIYFDLNYFSILCKSQFTLCPAGDAPWSMRFFEAVMCKSIPIIDKIEHTGRHDKERSIGYKFYFINDDHVYREDWVNENYDKFIKYQTLIDNI